MIIKKVSEIPVDLINVNPDQPRKNFGEDELYELCDSIKKYGYVGLILFVGIPLPGTGAWTGSLLAVLLNLDKKKSFICILAGVVLASVIMTIISYGFVGNLIR